MSRGRIINGIPQDAPPPDGCPQRIQSEGVRDGQDGRTGVLSEPRGGGLWAGEEMDFVAEGGTDGGNVVWGDDGDDGTGWGDL